VLLTDYRRFSIWSTDHG